MFLTEKTEKNRHLETFYGDISLEKVVQNDLICHSGCLSTYQRTPLCQHEVITQQDNIILSRSARHRFRFGWKNNSCICN